MCAVDAPNQRAELDDGALSRVEAAEVDVVLLLLEADHRGAVALHGREVDIRPRSERLKNRATQLPRAGPIDNRRPDVRGRSSTPRPLLGQSRRSPVWASFRYPQPQAGHEVRAQVTEPSAAPVTRRRGQSYGRVPSSPRCVGRMSATRRARSGSPLADRLTRDLRGFECTLQLRNRREVRDPSKGGPTPAFLCEERKRGKHDAAGDVHVA
jgi:hypothetical protein